MTRPPASSTAMLPSRVAQAESRAAGLHWQDVLQPLHGHALWFAMVFLLGALSVWVRLDVQELHRELDRTHRAQREAKMLHDRLSLELAVRNRSAGLEEAATQASLSSDVHIVHVDGAW